MTPVLESPAPAAPVAGRADAVLLGGHAPRGASLALRVNGREQPMAATGWRRPDLPADRAVWWAVAALPAVAEGETVAVDLLVDGAPHPMLALIAVGEKRAPGAPNTPTVAICLATYEPDHALLGAQIESLRAQTDTDWVCVISDDASADDSWHALVEGDDRFVIHRAPERGGFYRNFERALELAPDDCGLVALCDQDDVWHPDKLATLRAALGDATLVYSDQRLTAPDGRVLRETLWTGRTRNHDDLGALLVAGSITGAATLMRRDVAELALPFPRTPGVAFHDHWISLVALAMGRIAYVDRPLYDYVQHPGAVFGDVTSSGRKASRTDGAAAWFHGYLPRAMQARVLLDRVQPTGEKRAALEAFLAADRSAPALAKLAARGVADRGKTLRSELEIAAGPAWRRTAGRRRDTSPPPPVAFEQRRLRAWRSALT